MRTVCIRGYQPEALKRDRGTKKSHLHGRWDFLRIVSLSHKLCLTIRLERFCGRFSVAGPGSEAAAASISRFHSAEPKTGGIRSCGRRNQSFSQYGSENGLDQKLRLPAINHFHSAEPKTGGIRSCGRRHRHRRRLLLRCRCWRAGRRPWSCRYGRLPRCKS